MAAPPFLLDCDTGIDDSLALLYLLASPVANLVGITTVSGNVSAAQAAQNCLDLLEISGFEGIPVAVGAHDPLVGDFEGGVPHIHGANGVGNIELPTASASVVAESGAELIVKLADEYAGELRLVAIGPLTNLALALKLDPSLPTKISHLTIMGGAALAPGNITPVAEANIGLDPEAAAAVFAAPWPMTMVGLDVTMQQRMEEPARQRLLSSGKPVAIAIGAMLELYFEFYVNVYGHPSSALHDPLAAAIATGEVVPSLAPIVPVEIDATLGIGRGQTIADLRGQFRGYPLIEGAHCAVVLRVDEDFSPMLVDRILSL
ncbi:nucleoside hydrolase [Nakamurella antarctica]|uniref:Nucleoside hydrolase n=1 Tax=Nakamurella antarctica TaxID=1902245 RepID=A0A3G9A1B1_9ACTN|nr:nucleoside hydrolase [Nakamurella antarctica]